VELANHTAVIYAPRMRQCAKMRCEERAEATVALRYAERVVWIRDLLPQHDPNLLDLCISHANRLTPPLRWRLLDERRVDEGATGAGGTRVAKPVTVADRLPA
jgi:uncharacterized protein DUF3499